MADFSLDACYESVAFEVETLKVNVFEALGKAIIRAEQDVFYNKTMIEAYKKYISDHNIKWNEQFNSNRPAAVIPQEKENKMKNKIIEALIGRGYEAELKTVTKNNVKRDAVVMGSGTIRPTIYIDSIIENCTDVDKIVDRVIEIYEVSTWIKY